MTAVYRTLIEETIEGMEGGRFQDFCLGFLPIYDERFRGMTRLGHTAEGKTRPGTPDLIKTNSDGTQIAAQCGTGKGYWVPTSKIADWKPYADAKKCIDHLNNLVELVLISNQEIPTTAPNVKSDLISQLGGLTGAKVTPLSLEDICTRILSSLQETEAQCLLKEYCPEAYGAVAAEESRLKYEVASEIARAGPSSLGSLFELVDEAFERSGTFQERRQYVVEKFERVRFQYRLTEIPTFSGVWRESVEGLPLKPPLGKVWLLVGVPKIGKTTLLFQLRAQWADFDLHWYDCPVEESACGEAILLDLLETLLPGQDVSRLLKSQSGLQAQIAKGLTPLQKPSLFLIDNASELPGTKLTQLARILALVKSSPSRSEIGLIFVSNRRLLELAAVIDQELLVPRWTQAEIGKLLSFAQIDYDHAHEQAYLQLLENLTGGHPLLARAIARKSPTVEELLLSQIGSAPGVADEDLSKEVQSLLYEEVLVDPDSQNLVQRLSVLIGSAKEEIVEVLRTQVQPQISTSASVIINRVGGSVIEGDPINGYAVPLVFRELTRNKVSTTERNAVYKAVAAALLTPKERTLDATQVISGIHYSVLVGELEEVFFWTTSLVWNGVRQNRPVAQLSLILMQLSIVEHLQRPKEPAAQLRWAFTLFTCATAYFKIQEDDKVLQLLEKIGPIDRLPDNDSVEAKRLLGVSITIYEALSLARVGKSQALEVLSEVSASDFELLPSDVRQAFLDALTDLISIYSLSGLSSLWALEIFKKIEELPEEHDSTLKIASRLGSRAYANKLEAHQLDGFFPGTPFGKLLHHTALANYLAEARQSDAAIREAEEALNLFGQAEIKDGEGLAKLHIVKADAAYQMGSYNLAQKVYATALDIAPASSFTRGWATWRIGIISEDEAMFQSAWEVLQEAGYFGLAARALGARGALLIKSKREFEGIKCFETLTDAYFSEACTEYGPALAIAQAQLRRLINQSQEIPCTDPNIILPEFSFDPYVRVLDTAQPRFGPIAAHLNLAQAFTSVAEASAAQNCLSKALGFKPKNRQDWDFLPLVIQQRLEGIDDVKKNRSEISQCVDLMLSCQSIDTRSPQGFLSHCLFDKADKDAKEGKNLEKMNLILERLDSAGQQRPDHFWKAAILIRRAKLFRLENGDSSETARMFREALKTGKEGRNGTAVIDAAHTLSFQMETHFRSMKQLATNQLALVEGVELQNSDFDRLIIHGINLYNFWKTIDFRRLAESDLPTKKYLFDSAKAMVQSPVQDDQAAIVMLLLLLKLFNHQGPALEWAKSQIRLTLSDVPEEVAQLLTPLLAPGKPK